MQHVAKNFEHLIGQLHGLSEQQLRNHFQLYEGYVKKINEIDDKLDLTSRANANYSFSEYSELVRRRAVAFNGAYLHQLYFENLTGKKTKPERGLETAINNYFGSIENWYNETLAGLKSTNGWVLLCHSRIDGSLNNCVIEEHHRGLFVAQDILLAIDGWEHAFMIDYGVNEEEYFEAIRPNIDWEIASLRFQSASSTFQLAV